VDISVRVSDAPDGGRRKHFCPTVRREVSIEGDGISQDITLFCPLCAAPLVESRGNLRRDRTDNVPAYAGARCAHGLPDTTCSKVVELEPAYEYPYLWGVPEFQALRWAEELGVDPGLIAEWAHACGICRATFAQVRYGVLELDLRRLSESLTKAGSKAQERVLSLSHGLSVIHALLAELDERKNAIRAERTDEDLGYVYAISDWRASCGPARGRDGARSLRAA
jgi:hypothetical protein